MLNIKNNRNSQVKKEKSDKSWFCPLTNSDCQEEQCGFYFERFARCSLPVLTQNVWTLEMAIIKMNNE